MRAVGTKIVGLHSAVLTRLDEYQKCALEQFLLDAHLVDSRENGKALLSDIVNRQLK